MISIGLVACWPTVTVTVGWFLSNCFTRDLTIVSSLWWTLRYILGVPYPELWLACCVLGYNIAPKRAFCAATLDLIVVGAGSIIRASWPQALTCEELGVFPFLVGVWLDLLGFVTSVHGLRACMVVFGWKVIAVMLALSGPFGMLIVALIWCGIWNRDMRKCGR